MGEEPQREIQLLLSTISDMDLNILVDWKQMSVDQEIIIKSRCVCAHFQKILLDIPPSTQQCLLLRHLIVWDRIHRAQEKGVETAIFPFNNPPRTEFEQSGLVAGRCPIDETD